MSLNRAFVFLSAAVLTSAFILLAGPAEAATQQTDYWFRDDDGSETTATGFGAEDVSQNTQALNVFGGGTFRLRLGIKATVGSETFSPQIEFKEGASCSGAGWTQITTSSNNFTLQSSPNFTDSGATTKQITSGSFTAGKILESTNPAPSLTLSTNRSTEYEWSLKASETNPTDTTYAFRVSNAGTALSTYSDCALLTTELTAEPSTGVVWNQADFQFRDEDGSEATASGLTGQNLLPDARVDILDQNDFNAAKIFRLRFAVRANNDIGAVKPRLEYKLGGGGCADPSDWQVMGTDPNNPFILRDSVNVGNNTPTTQRITAGPDFVPGLFLDTQNNPDNFNVIARNGKSEYEWALKNTKDELSQILPNTVYYFRLTNNGAPFGLYSNCPVITFGGVPGQPTEIRFSGQAYPGAKVNIYAKDRGSEFPIKQEEITSSGGDFRTSYIGILQNTYNYSLVITDKNGRTSQVKSYNLDVYANSLNATDIFVSPTLGLLRGIVTKGDFITAAGYASPGGNVEFEIDDRLIFGRTTAGSDGAYKWLSNTAGLSFGQHRVRARQTGGFNKKSDWSPTVIFSVSRLLNPQTDLNKDGIINISDWSIFLVRFKSEDDNQKALVDLNGDGKTDISDFSVFLRTIKSSRF